MKKVIIIGAGITGLRAAWELVESERFEVTVVEKSPSVGGRVATRRFENSSVNHGAQSFGGWERVQRLDPLIGTWNVPKEFHFAATDLPKQIRDRLMQFPRRFSLKTNWQVQSLKDAHVVSNLGERIDADIIIATAPIPQVEQMTQQVIPNVEYEKCILFIGERDKKSVRIEMDSAWSDKHFDLTDDGILVAARSQHNLDLAGLIVKKWRYSRVVQGLKLHYMTLGPSILVAGDAFDPNGDHDLAASWISGFEVAKHILEDRHE